MADVERPGTLEKNAGDTEIQFERQGAQTLLIRLSGRWTIRSSPPAVEALRTQLDSFEDVHRVAFDTGDITTGTAAC